MGREPVSQRVGVLRRQGSGAATWKPTQWHLLTHESDCRVSSAWECQHNVTRARGANGVWYMPPTSQEKKLTIVRDMKELSKIHETSCMDCET